MAEISNKNDSIVTTGNWKCQEFPTLLFEDSSFETRHSSVLLYYSHRKTCQPNFQEERGSFFSRIFPHKGDKLKGKSSNRQQISLYARGIEAFMEENGEGYPPIILLTLS